MAESSPTRLPDALDLVLEAFKGGATTSITYQDAAGNKVDALTSSTQVAFHSSDDAATTILPKTTLTRLTTSRDLAARVPTPTPATQPTAFLPLDAVLFALEHREEGPGAYLRLTTSAGVARLDARDRNAVLEYLVGKTTTWEGVISKEAVNAVESAAPSTILDPSAAAAAIDASNLSTASDSLPVRSTTPTSAAPTVPTVQKRPYVPNAQDAEFVKRQRTQTEVILRTRTDVLRTNLVGARTGGNSSGKLVDFGLFRKSILGSVDEIRKAGSKGAASSKGANVPPPVPAAGVGRVKRNRAAHPIILLSNSPTSLISMFNVKRLLEEGVFVPPEVAKAEANGMAEGVVTVTRIWGGGIRSGAAKEEKGGGKAIRFLVVDTHEALSKFAIQGQGQLSDPWQRVVAVFTTGQSWQFRFYKWTDPKDLFKNVMGIYMRYNNEKQTPAIDGWNVRKFQVDVSKRHTDKQLIENFWRTLEEWIAARKGWLLQ